LGFGNSQAWPHRSPQQKPPPLFVDVGANLGWMAALAAHWGCRVIAFEPQVMFPNITSSSPNAKPRPTCGHGKRATVCKDL